MVRDDYFVIVYQILSYLYQQLKDGKDIKVDMLKEDGPLFSINHNYWVFIMKSLIENEYIQGVAVKENIIDGTHVVFYDNIGISVKGMEYLLDNNLLSKAKKLLKELKEIAPLIIKN